MVTRDTLATDLHRLSNLIECKLSEYLQQLVIEQRYEGVEDLAFTGCRFIKTLRSVRDGKESEGGDA